MNAVFHRETFLMHAGPGPWPCHFCGESVEHTRGGKRTPLQFMVHHVDHNHLNNDPLNLAAAHHKCHSGYHVKLRPMTDEIRAKISATKRARFAERTARA